MKNTFITKHLSVWSLSALLFCSCGKSNSSAVSSADSANADEFAALEKVADMPVTNKSDEGRFYAVSFTIGDSVAFVGSGSGATIFDSTLRDFWKFNGSEWTQVSSIPIGRQQAVAFSIGEKGYVGTGRTSGENTSIYLNDFYSYDMLTDKWSSIAGLPAGGRARATAFVLNGKGYIVAGETSNDTYSGDMFSFDPTDNGNNWKQEANIPADDCAGATSFTYENKGYIVGGYTSVGNKLSNHFFEYDPVSASWTAKKAIDTSSDASYINIERREGVALVLGSKVYYMTGSDSVSEVSPASTVWAWDPARDVWTKGADYSEIARWGAVGFTINGKGYIGTGWNGSIPAFHDFYEFIPK